MALKVLAKAARELGVELLPPQIEAFEVYRSELATWNRRVNLTAVTDPGEVELRHFVDSLYCLEAMRDQISTLASPRLIDVGTGAGLPGLPLKIARPSLSLTLVESVGKKTTFLKHIVARLRLSKVVVYTTRAEELATTPEHRDSYDLAVCRALAPLPTLVELCLPFLAIGGRLVAPRGGDLVSQQRHAERATIELGGRFSEALQMAGAGGQAGRGLVVVDKVAATPARFPRRPGMAAKRPLL